MAYTAPLAAIVVVSLVYYNKCDILRWLYRRNNKKEKSTETQREDIYRLRARRFGVQGQDTIILTEEDTADNISLISRPLPIVMATLHPGDKDMLADIRKYNHTYHTRKEVKARDLIPWMTESQTLEVLLRDGWLEEVSADDCVPV